jgi:hypothetical protein
VPVPLSLTATVAHGGAPPCCWRGGAWTSPRHHYGSRVPRREEAAFTVGLTADLLTHAGHLLEAHPEPLQAGPAIAVASATVADLDRGSVLAD